MNISDQHIEGKLVSTNFIFKSEKGSALALRILANGELKEHFSIVPAILVCVKGKATYEDENGLSETLNPGDFVKIQPKIKHRVLGIENTDLILIK